MKDIQTKNLKTEIPGLRAGDRVFLTGEVYTARDAAHRRIFELLDGGDSLPFELEGAVIYYTGPTPARDGMPVGSCGPTTSSRMDQFTPRLLELGVLAMIGKGERGDLVIDAIMRRKCVYFCAVGGAGALMAKHVSFCEEIAFPELGCESVKRLYVEKLPLTVAIDSQGGNLFDSGRALYART